MLNTNSENWAHGNNSTVVHFDAGRDRNGNAKRLFLVVVRQGTWAIDEGCLGVAALDGPWGPEVGKVLRTRVVARVAISKKEYKRLLKEYPDPSTEKTYPSEDCYDD